MLCCNLFPCNLFIMWALHDFPFSTTWCNLIKKMAWSEHENMKLHANFRALLKKKRPEPQRGWVLRQRLGCRAKLFREFLVFFSIRIRCFVRFLHERITWKSVFVPKKRSRSRDQREEIYRVKEIVGSFDWHMIHEPLVQVPPKTPIPKNTS